MGVPVPGGCELAGAAAGRSKARADAGGLRGAGGWDAPVAGLSAQSGREPGGLGRLFEQSVWARLERQEPAADRDRRLPRPGRRASDRLSAGEAQRCFVEVRRRTRPMVCFVNVASVDRIIYAIFNGYNEQHEWRNRTLRLFTQAA